MNRLTASDVSEYVESHIGEFHQQRLQRLGVLKLKEILSRKNPYLFKAKNIETAKELVQDLMNAYLSSAEETLFGNWLEGLAIFVCEKAYRGWKSSTEGIDLEFDRKGTRYIVSIKSGPNWGNSSQKKKMLQNFASARNTLRTGGARLSVIAVNGCCYGRDDKPYKGNGDYYKYCGQRFWEFISGDKELFLTLIKPLGHLAKESNQAFMSEYPKVVEKLADQFADEFCDQDGNVDWDKIVRLNSASKK